MPAMATQVRYAVFDVDDTLYPSSCGMWLHIRSRINRYMVERLSVSETEAPIQRERYFLEHGTCLAGLMHDYPDLNSDEYLAYVHDLPYERYLVRDDGLSRMLSELRLEKSVFTNADRGHAVRVLSALGVEEYFDIIVDVHATNFINKPRIGAFHALLETLNAEPCQCVLIDDQGRNIEMAQSLGMATIHVGPRSKDDGLGDFWVPDIGHAVDAFRVLGGA